MTVTAASFRGNFPEFKSTTTFPDSQVNYYLSLGDKMLVNPLRWGNVRDNGLELFVAHNLFLEGKAQATAAAGGIPGAQMGVLSSKSVGPVSASYDTTAGLELDGGHWNLSVYGTRFLNLARMIGTGGIQL